MLLRPQPVADLQYKLLEEEIVRDTNAGFDWIYVDVSYCADDTFLGAEPTWRLAREGR
jgi:hypothetical protein